MMSWIKVGVSKITHFLYWKTMIVSLKGES